VKTIQILIEDDYLETFLESLPKDKVKIIDQTFIEYQQKLQEELQNFLHGKGEFTPYYEAMKEMDNWIKEGAEQ
jgi:hypothetical protein